jgi:hypothetical protein
MAQVLGCLTSKCEALSSIPQSTKQTNKKNEKRNQVNKNKEVEEILQNLTLEI